MLNGKEPKIVNGPEMLSKYVGASEENIRNLFKDAEAEYKLKGEDSDLHVIIFDELIRYLNKEDQGNPMVLVLVIMLSINYYRKWMVLIN